MKISFAAQLRSASRLFKHRETQQMQQTYARDRLVHLYGLALWLFRTALRL
jgi:hypothetical protein